MSISPKLSPSCTTSDIRPSGTPAKQRSTPPCASTALYFDHNLHALRIVEDFEVRYAAFRGLNLTFEVREGIIKHSHDYAAADHPELAEYLLDVRPPLEAQLIDLTDEIAYNTADLDDGYESRLLAYDQIRDGVPVFDRYAAEVEQLYPDVAEKLKFNETVKRFLNRLVGDLIENTKADILRANIKTLEDVRRHPARLAAFSPAVEEERKQAKSFLYENLYYSPSLAPEKDDAERVITELFAFWMKDPPPCPTTIARSSRKIRSRGSSAITSPG